MMKKILLTAVIAISVLSLAGCSTKRGPKATGDLTTGASQADQAQTFGLDDSQIYGDDLNSQGYAPSGAGAESLPSICRPSAKQAQTAGVDQHYFFAFNKSALHPRARASLKLQVQYLINNPNVKIRVAGNTDNRGSREYNVALGWRRAKAVSQDLMQFGVNKNQIQTVSYGAEKPVAFGTSNAAYQCNRRVDLSYFR